MVRHFTVILCQRNITYNWVSIFEIVSSFVFNFADIIEDQSTEELDLIIYLI